MQVHFVWLQDVFTQFNKNAYRSKFEARSVVYLYYTNRFQHFVNQDPLSSISFSYSLPYFIHSEQSLGEYLQLNCKIKAEQNHPQIRLINLSTVQSGYPVIFQMLTTRCVPMFVTQSIRYNLLLKTKLQWYCARLWSNEILRFKGSII